MDDQLDLHLVVEVLPGLHIQVDVLVVDDELPDTPVDSLNQLDGGAAPAVLTIHVQII